MNRPGDQNQTAAQLETEWKTDARWNGITRDYSAEDVIALRGPVREERTLARRGSQRLWELIHSEEWVPALGALTGNQAVQQVRAGLKAIYLSGWQVAADANLSGQTYPDQSLYPATRCPPLCAASTTRCCVRRRSRASRATTASGSPPSSPTPRPASADRSTPTS